MVRSLSLQGATVYFTTRSEAKAQETRTILETHNPEINQGKIKWLQLDLSDLKSITSAAEELQRKESKIDILGMLQSAIPSPPVVSDTIANLVNNAGVATSSNNLANGWEYHMAIKYELFLDPTCNLLTPSAMWDLLSLSIVSCPFSRTV